MLKIDSRSAQIGINFRLPVVDLNIHQPQGKAYIKDPQLNIRAEAATLEIDQTRCFEEVGYYKPVSFGKKVYNESKKKTLQAIKKIATDGNMLARIEKHPKAIATIAKRDFNQTKGYNVAMVPKTPPDITVHKGHLQISSEEGTVSIERAQWSVTVNPSHEAVNIYLKQKPELNIEYLGNRVDLVR